MQEYLSMKTRVSLNQLKNVKFAYIGSKGDGVYTLRRKYQGSQR